MAAFVALWAGVEALAGQVLTVYSPYQVVFTRYVVHLALLAAVWGWREPASLWRTRRPAYQLGRSLLMLVMPASWILSMERGIAPATTMAILWLSPLLVLLFARWVLGERASPVAWITTAAACAGTFAVLRPTTAAGGALLVFPLGMATSFALYVAMTRSLRSETTRANLFYTALGVVLALALAMPRLWVTPPLRDALIMVGVGVLGFVTLWALDRLAAAAPLSASAPLAPLQLGFTVALESATHGGSPRLSTAVGLSAIGAAALYAWFHEPAPITT